MSKNTILDQVMGSARSVINTALQTEDAAQVKICYVRFDGQDRVLYILALDTVPDSPSLMDMISGKARREG